MMNTASIVYVHKIHVEASNDQVSTLREKLARFLETIY